MKKSEVTAVTVIAGVLVAGTADLVIHHDKIRRSLQGQQQHYATKDRGAVSRLAHALASQTVTGRLLTGALQQVVQSRALVE